MQSYLPSPFPPLTCFWRGTLRFGRSFHICPFVSSLIVHVDEVLLAGVVLNIQVARNILAKLNASMVGGLCSLILFVDMDI